MKFAVGMIVTHKQKEYDQPTDSSAGVIIGWHRYIDRHNVKFSINKLSDPVLPLKIYRNFSSTKQQTHYIILTENNEMCYVNEGMNFILDFYFKLYLLFSSSYILIYFSFLILDAITKTTPKWIDNNEIGRYFCKFQDTHYVPNKMLARLYPHDITLTTLSDD